MISEHSSGYIVRPDSTERHLRGRRYHVVKAGKTLGSSSDLAQAERHAANSGGVVVDTQKRKRGGK